MTNYQFDNNHLKWSNIFGHLFSIVIYCDKKHWNITVYDHTGQTTLTNLSQLIIDKETDILSNENYDKLSNVTKNFVYGIVNCSHFKSEIDKHENRKHRFYAGIYCENCWNSIYKEKEANENYN